MSDEQPYGNEDWDDVPLPDAGQSWQKMEALLDKDERRRRALPWWFWRGAAGGLLLIALTAGVWWWMNKGDGSVENKVVTVEEKTTARPENSASTNKGTGTTQEAPVTEKPSNQTNVPSTETAVAQPEKSSANERPSLQTPPPPATEAKGVRENFPSTKNALRKTAKSNTMPSTKLKPQKSKSGNAGFVSGKLPPVEKPFVQGKDEKEKTLIAKDEPAVAKPDSEEAKTNLPSDTLLKNVAVKDSTRRLDSLKTAAPPVVLQEEKKADKKQSPAFVWSVGIGLQRAIALNGQSSSPYNYSGNQSFVTDNLPSVYLRLQSGKWFAQAEFNYAVPQPVKAFSFSQKTSYGASGLMNIERFSVQKLYYHQLPFSINYSPVPQWSVGAGAVYNLLAGAVTEQEVTSKNLQTGAETVSRNLAPVKGYKDSFLYKTTAGLLLQTDYHWKRFSLGLRYTQNLQPFIKYTRPAGEVLDEKNNSLQAVLRFRLWRRG